jgi:hypothetical protein
MTPVSEKARTLLEEALRLPEAERLKLAFEILESVEGAAGKGDGLPQEWREQVSRRVDSILQGSGRPDEEWRVVLDRIRSVAPRS